MRIVMLSDLQSDGGAARAAARLAQALRDRGHEVVRLFGRPDSGAPSPQLVRLRPPPAVVAAARVVGPFSPSAGDRTTHWGTARALQRKLLDLRPDVINVHNLHAARWRPDLIEICAARAPVVWTLHDMWSLTGRCAYAYDCRAFVDGCSASCPTWHEYPPLPPEQIRSAWESRFRTYARMPGIVVVTPSRWLAAEAREGMWRSHRIETIPAGVPTDVFAPPAEREVLRRRLDVQEGELVALMAAQVLDDRRKGLRYAVEALSGRARPGLSLLLLGRAQGMPSIPGLRVKQLGFVAEDAGIAEIYGAADFLLHPAPVDNLPNVVLEAMACGTPAVAFPIGGLPEMIRPGRTGWLAREPSSTALGAAVDEALAQLRAGPGLRQACRDTAVTDYAPELQAQRYDALFTALVSRPQHRRWTPDSW